MAIFSAAVSEHRRDYAPCAVFICGFAAAAAFLVCFFASFAWGKSMATVGQDDGYSGRVLDRITSKWNPPPQLKGNLKLKIILSVDGDGNLIDCKVQKRSGLDALDVSACGAASQASPFGPPPYGMPASLYFTFWSGGINAIPPESEPGKFNAFYAERAANDARAANERARAAAEAAAKSAGKKMKNAPALKNNAEKARPEKAESGKMSEAPKAMTGKNAAELPEPKMSVPVASQPKKVAAEVKKTSEPAEGKKTQTAENAKPAASPASKDGAPARPQPAEAATPSGPEIIVNATPPDKSIDDAKYSKYLRRITWDLRNSMFVPAETMPGKYYATVKISCDKQGKILSSDLIKGTGDAIMDKYVMAGIKRAKRIVPPPPGYGNTFELIFSLVRK